MTPELNVNIITSNLPSIPSVPSVPNITSQLNVKLPNIPDIDEILPDKPQVEELDTNVPMPKPIKRCPTCEIQKKEKEQEKKIKELKKTIDDKIDKLTEAPEQAFNNVKKSVSKFIDVVKGEDDDQSEEGKNNPTLGLQQINVLITPVSKLVEQIPFKNIVPGLSEFTGLLTSLIDFSKPSNPDEPPSADIPPELSDEESSLADDFTQAMQTFATSFNLIIIELIIEMINKIIELIKKIAEAVGINMDSLPEPLNSLVKLIELIPNLYKLSRTLPNKMSSTMKTLFKKKLQEIQKLSRVEPLEKLTDVDIKCETHSDNEETDNNNEEPDK